MHKVKPCVSIGLPVYNGENFIIETLDSILSQTYIDFELIISDNASTDNTQNICKAYAAKDKRIRYYRNDLNLGGAWNYNRVLELSQGTYFKWAAHDDLLTPTLIAECVDILDNDSSIVLCHSKTSVIDENSRLIDFPFRHLELTDSLDPCLRFHSILFNLVSCDQIFGLIRSLALKQTSCYCDYWTADKGLIAELSLWGRFYELDQSLLFRRSHPDQVTRQPLHKKYEWFNSPRALRMPYQLQATKRYLSSIYKAPLTLLQKVNCYVSVLGLIFQLKKWENLVSDTLKLSLPQYDT